MVKVSSDIDEQSDTSAGAGPLELDVLATRGQHLSLGGKHREIRGEARVVALRGQAERLLGITEGLLLLHQAGIQCRDVTELIRCLLHGAEDCLVVGGQRYVYVRSVGAVLCPESA